MEIYKFNNFDKREDKSNLYECYEYCDIALPVTYTECISYITTENAKLNILEEVILKLININEKKENIKKILDIDDILYKNILNNLINMNFVDNKGKIVLKDGEDYINGNNIICNNTETTFGYMFSVYTEVVPVFVETKIDEWKTIDDSIEKNCIKLPPRTIEILENDKYNKAYARYIKETIYDKYDVEGNKIKSAADVTRENSKVKIFKNENREIYVHTKLCIDKFDYSVYILSPFKNNDNPSFYNKFVVDFLNNSDNKIKVKYKGTEYEFKNFIEIKQKEIKKNQNDNLGEGLKKYIENNICALTDFNSIADNIGDLIKEIYIRLNDFKYKQDSHNNTDILGRVYRVLDIIFNLYLQKLQNNQQKVYEIDRFIQKTDFDFYEEISRTYNLFDREQQELHIYKKKITLRTKEQKDWLAKTLRKKMHGPLDKCIILIIEDYIYKTLNTPNTNPFHNVLQSEDVDLFDFIRKLEFISYDRNDNSFAHFNDIFDKDVDNNTLNKFLNNFYYIAKILIKNFNKEQKYA